MLSSKEELWLVPVERQLDVTEEGESFDQSAQFDMSASWVYCTFFLDSSFPTI